MATQIQIANLSQFLASVRDAQKQCANLTEPLTSIGLDWMRTNQTIFALSGPGQFADLSGGKPARNAKTGRYQSQNGGYKAQKLKKWGFVYPILKASGALQRSLTQPGDSGSLFQIINQQTLILGTKVTGKGGANYPAFLNFGTSKMPARSFMNVPQISVARWTLILKTYIVGKLSASGSGQAQIQG